MVTTARKRGVGTLGLVALLSLGLTGLGGCGAEDSGGRPAAAGPEDEGAPTTATRADSASAATAATRPGLAASGGAGAEPAGGAGAEPAGGAGAEAPSTGTAGTEPFEGTVGWTEQPGTVEDIATLVSVRTGRHSQFDRIVFDFAGTAMPGYRIEYVDRPARQCGSGAAVPLEGNARLAVRFMPARAHEDQGRPTVANRVQAPGLTTLKELKQTCDFEGQVEWVFGVAAQKEYRVLELVGPTRLVIDVRH